MRLRKHAHALLAAAAFNFIFFFPVLFMGRVVSPNDVFYNTDPWALLPHDPVQNSLLSDPPTSYLTQAKLLKEGGSWDWNPYLASGIPGVAATPALFSPFDFFPIMLLPLAWNYTATLLLKFNIAFWFAYLWLREERLGKRAAAVGALIAAGAGVYTIRWLWPATNAAALYPALLWIARRIFNGKRTSIALMTIIAASYGVAHFPAAQAYGAWMVLAYMIFLAVRGLARRSQRKSVSASPIPIRTLAEAASAVVLGLLIVSPSLATFVQFIHRTGYLAIRENLSLRVFYPLSHFASFLAPDRLGNDAFKNWKGDPALGMFNNYLEATIYVGILTIPLALAGIANVRARSRFFWAAAAVVLLAAMFGLAGVPAIIGRLPGFKYSPLARAVLLLPMPAAYLGASGAGWIEGLIRSLARRLAAMRRQASASVVRLLPSLVVAAIALSLAWDLGVFAGRFYPFLEPEKADVPETPTISFLLAQPRPFRMAAFFTYFLPNAAEMFRVEDIRSHFSSDAKYRRLLQRIDPTSWTGQSTVLLLDSRRTNFADPLLGMLGVRYFIEHKAIDIVKWSIFAATEPAVKQTGSFIVKPGVTLQRTIRVDAEPFYAIELPISVDAQVSRAPHVSVDLLKYGGVVWSRDFTPADIGVLSKVYVPLRPFARLGDTVTLRVTPVGLSISVLQSVPFAGESPLFYGRVKTPVIFDRELPDGRIFANVGELPRFRVASRLLKLSEEQFLARRDIDFGDTAVITDPNVSPPPTASSADVTLHVARYTNAEQRLTTDAPRPFFLASSEKLTPELRVTIDRREAPAVEINSLFAGVAVPAGHHRIVFSRRVGRGWWWPAGIALAIFIVIAALEIVAALRRRA